MVGADARTVMVSGDGNATADEAVVQRDTQHVSPCGPAVAGPRSGAVEVAETRISSEVAERPRPRRRVEVAADDDAPAELRPSRSGESTQVPHVNRACKRRMNMRHDDGHGFAGDADARHD